MRVKGTHDLPLLEGKVARSAGGGNSQRKFTPPVFLAGPKIQLPLQEGEI